MLVEGVCFWLQDYPPRFLVEKYVGIACSVGLGTVCCIGLIGFMQGWIGRWVVLVSFIRLFLLVRVNMVGYLKL